MLLLLLSWAVFGTAVVLLMLKLWLWVDCHEDWRVVRTLAPDDARYTQARGAMRMAWLRVLTGGCWLALGFLVLTANPYNATPLSTRYASRVIMLLLIGIEMAKILSERFTRIELIKSVARKLHEKSVARAKRVGER